MSLDALYADDIEQGIQSKLANPGPGPGMSFRSASFAAAGMRGGLSGGLELSAAVLDAMGLKFAGTDVMRQMATAQAPDAATTHVADQVLYGFTRVGSKVAAATAAAPTAGAAALLFGEGTYTGSEALKAKGIDADTALKAGAVEGAGQAAAMIPMAGPTIKATVGLGLAAGPGTFMAQEALSRRILEKAGYANEAARHDPLDPLGLTIATLLPGVVGGVHIAGLARAPKPTLAAVVESLESGGKRFGADGQLLTSPKGAQGEMQVMPGTSRDPGFGVKPAADNSPEELARVGRDYLDAMHARYGEPDQALAAYNAGPGAVDKAIAAHGADWLAHMPEETQAYVKKGMGKLGDDVVTHAASDPAAIDAARVRTTQDALYRSMPDEIEAPALVARATDQVAAGEMPLMPEMGPRIEDSAAMLLARENNTFSGQAVGAGQRVGMTQPPGTPVDKLFSNFGDAKLPETWRDRTGQGRTRQAAEAEQAAKFRQAMFDRADGSPAQFAKDEVLSSDHPAGDGRTFVVDAARSGKTRVRVMDGDEVIAAARIENGMIDSIAVRDSAKGQNVGGRLLQFLDQQKLANIDEVPDRSPGFVKIQQQAIMARSALSEPVSASRGTNTLPPADHVAEATPAARETPAAKPETTSGETVTPEAQRVAQIAKASPDLMVTLPGADKPVKLADALRMAQEEHAQALGDTNLVQAALECALSFGG